MLLGIRPNPLGETNLHIRTKSIRGRLGCPYKNGALEIQDLDPECGVASDKRSGSVTTTPHRNPSSSHPLLREVGHNLLPSRIPCPKHIVLTTSMPTTHRPARRLVRECLIPGARVSSGPHFWCCWWGPSSSNAFHRPEPPKILLQIRTPSLVPSLLSASSGRRRPPPTPPRGN
jgi:hypothetical protein